MSIIQEITKTDEQSLKAWATDYMLYWELEKERVKGLPELQEWAATVVTPTRRTDNGWIPGWDIDDCARKWVETYGFDFPAPPVTLPPWAGEAYEVMVVSHHEMNLYATQELPLSDGRIAKIDDTFYIDVEDAAVRRDAAVFIEGFGEKLCVLANELDDVIAALFAARHAITGVTLE